MSHGIHAHRPCQCQFVMSSPFPSSRAFVQSQLSTFQASCCHLASVKYLTVWMSLADTGDATLVECAGQSKLWMSLAVRLDEIPVQSKLCTFLLADKEPLASPAINSASHLSHQSEPCRLHWNHLLLHHLHLLLHLHDADLHHHHPLPPPHPLHNLPPAKKFTNKVDAAYHRPIG